MTEDTGTTEAQAEVDEDDGDDPKVPKELRAAYNRTKAENEKLKAQLLEKAYADAGLDTSGGLGKAIAKLYDGEPTTENILEYAKEEFGYEPSKKPENPVQPVIQQQQQALDVIDQVGIPVDPQTEQEALNKAESEGDFDTAGAIKAARLARMYRP